jgi:hypothetical protein
MSKKIFDPEFFSFYVLNYTPKTQQEPKQKNLGLVLAEI